MINAGGVILIPVGSGLTGFVRGSWIEGSSRGYTPGVKSKTPSGPCSAREGVRTFWCAVDCAGGGPGGYGYPGSIVLRLRGLFAPSYSSITHATGRRVALRCLSFTAISLPPVKAKRDLPSIEALQRPTHRRWGAKPARLGPRNSFCRWEISLCKSYLIRPTFSSLRSAHIDVRDHDSPYI